MHCEVVDECLDDAVTKMGRRRVREHKSHTLPSSPTHSFSSSSSSSSSDFEFTISLSPRKSSTYLCPADELFYKGQLLPLHLSPRLSMVRTLLASSSTSSSSDTATTTTASRDSTGSSTDSFSSDLLLADSCDSSRPSSAAEDDDFKRLNHHHHHHQIKKSKYFSLSRFSSVFRKEPKPTRVPDNPSASSVKRMSATAKEVICKYLKKVKPLYDKLSQKHQQKMATATRTSAASMKPDRSAADDGDNARRDSNGSLSQSFSGNLRYPRRRSCVSSCPSSMRSSPSHSGVLYGNRFSGSIKTGDMCYADASSMEELQSAIQGAIAHCKNSMLQNKCAVSNEI